MNVEEETDEEEVDLCSGIVDDDENDEDNIECERLCNEAIGKYMEETPEWGVVEVLESYSDAGLLDYNEKDYDTKMRIWSDLYEQDGLEWIFE